MQVQISVSEIGEILESLRKSKNLTQSELAGRSGVSQQNISAIEKGLVTPSIYVVEELAKAMNITFLIGGR